MKIKQYKKDVKRNTYRKLKLTVLLSVLVCAGFYGAWYKAIKFVEARDNTNYQNGYEVGHFEGLQEGADSAYDEFYDKLSPNPTVSLLFKKYFPNQEEARVMRAISLAESSGKQTAVNKANRNGSSDFGFFQINTIHKKKGESLTQFNSRMHLLEENFKEARKVLDKQGLSAWSTYNNLAYKQFLK